MLTPTQLTALRDYIAADPVLAAYPANSDGAFAIAEVLNQPASPAWYVWRTQYTPDQIRTAITNGITQLDALTASKRDSLLWWAEGSHDMNRAEVRAAINDLTGSQNTLKAALNDGGKRTATVAEKVLSTGTGSFAAPATAGWEGTLSYNDVQAARAA